MNRAAVGTAWEEPGEPGRTLAANELVDRFAADIEIYRRQESRALGCDLGFDWAAEEWLAAHVPAWRELQWQQLVRQTIRSHLLRLGTEPASA